MKNKTESYKSLALVVDPQSNEKLGKISIDGDPVPVTDWINTNGPLQSFLIIEGWDELRRVWHRQEEALILTKVGQRFIKFITYPTEGETQGYLDYTSELKPYDIVQTQNKPAIRRGLAYLQSLLGT